MEERVSRGLAAGDLDNDGRLDVVINDLDGPRRSCATSWPSAATGCWSN